MNVLFTIFILSGFQLHLTYSDIIFKTTSNNIVALAGTNPPTIQWTYTLTAGSQLYAIAIDHRPKGATTWDDVKSGPKTGPLNDVTGGSSIANRYQATVSGATITLQINNLQCADNGDIRISGVGNTVVNTVERSIQVNVKPTTNPVISKPSTTLEEGQNITMSCSGHLGKPATSSFKWKKKVKSETTYRDISSTPVLVLSNNSDGCSKDGTSTISVVLTPDDDRAEYKCETVVDQSIGPVSLSASNTLTVLYKVRLNNPQTGVEPEPVTAVEGSTRTLDCTATGNPAPTYTWTATPVVTSGDTTGATYTTSVLTLSNNEDVYECTASNIVNGRTINVSKVYALTVKGKDRWSVSDDTGTIVGSIIGVLAAVALGLLLLFICRKRKQRNNTRESAAYELPKITRKQSDNYTSLNKFEVAASDVSLDDKLGEGNFGEVWRGTYTDTGNKTTVAVKRLKEEQDHKDFKNEWNIMKNIDPHPNIVKLIGYCCQEPVLILLEYMEQGDLKKYLQDSRGRHIYGNLHGNSQSVTQENLVSFSLDIAHGMEHIVSRKLLHRDLAARNVLLTKNNVCKISDFGSTKDVQNSREYESKTQRPLPIRWMAPESLHDSMYTTKSDVWSYGVLLYEIFTLGATPYPGMSGHTVMKEVKRGFRMDRPTHCDDKLYAIMHQCWKEYPDDRPTFTELSQTFLKIKSENYNYIDLSQISENMYEEINRSEDEKI